MQRRVLTQIAPYTTGPKSPARLARQAGRKSDHVATHITIWPIYREIWESWPQFRRARRPALAPDLTYTLYNITSRLISVICGE